MKNPFLVVPIVILITSLLTIGIFAVSNLEDGENKEPIYLIVDSWAGYIPLYVAYENGFFEDEGVMVNFDILTNSEEIGAKISEENSPYDGYPGVYPQVLGSGEIDFNSSAVYVFDYSYGGDVVVANPSINSIADLKGKTISVVYLNSFSHRFVVSLLEKNGLSEDDVEIVVISAYDVLDALEKGEIDAGHTWDPIKTEAVEAGYNLIASSKETPGLIIDVLAIKKDVILEREKDIQGIVNALVRSYDFIKNNKDEAYSLMSNRTNVPLPYLVDASAGIKLIDLEENILMLTDSGSSISLYRTSEDISDFMIDHGQLKEKFFAENLIDSRFVKETLLSR